MLKYTTTTGTRQPTSFTVSLRLSSPPDLRGAIGEILPVHGKSGGDLCFWTVSIGRTLRARPTQSLRTSNSRRAAGSFQPPGAQRSTPIQRYCYPRRPVFRRSNLPFPSRHIGDSHLKLEQNSAHLDFNTDSSSNVTPSRSQATVTSILNPATERNGCNSNQRGTWRCRAGTTSD